MRRVYLLAMSAVLCALMAACGGSSRPTQSPAPNQTTLGPIPSESHIHHIGVGKNRGYASVQDLVFVNSQLYVRSDAKTITGKDEVTDENALFLEWNGKTVQTRWYHKPTPNIPKAKVVPKGYLSVKIIL